MSLLQYTSNEMFSSTELIRKSKMVFDKINNKEIEKAIILRDGKPSFMLLDFVKYEELITEYIQLKNGNNTNKTNHQATNKKAANSEKPAEKKVLKETEIANDELEKALNDIDSLELDFRNEEIKTDKTEALKEFWE